MAQRRPNRETGNHAKAHRDQIWCPVAQEAKIRTSFRCLSISALRFYRLPDSTCRRPVSRYRPSGHQRRPEPCRQYRRNNRRLRIFITISLSSYRLTEEERAFLEKERFRRAIFFSMVWADGRLYQAARMASASATLAYQIRHCIRLPIRSIFSDQCASTLRSL